MSKKFKTPEEEQDYLDSISFYNLVKAIDEKWAHTYLEYVEGETQEVEETLSEL